jgi:PleD family two-component response regulator
MLTYPAFEIATAFRADNEMRKWPVAQKVVIVNGSTDTFGLIETVLDAGRYDIVSVESNKHAYSQIKRVQPDLVVLCIRIDDLDAFRVLSMLKLDEETRGIPILTCTTESGDQTAQKEADEEPSDSEVFVTWPAPQMN